MTEQSG